MLSFLLLMVSEENKPKIYKLYDDNHQKMLGFARRRLRFYGLRNYNIDAEDVVENAFLKIATYAEKINFDAPEKSLKSYIFTIVSNESINMARGVRHYEDIDNIADELTDDEFIEKMHIQETYNTVIEKIKKLDERYSTLLFMYYCQEIPVKELADFLGIPVKTVYTRLARAKTLLLREMKD